MQGNSTRAGWLVVAGSAISLIVGNGAILVFTFGVFLRPITEQMGWQRGTASIGVALGLTLGGLATPLVGHFIDKWGIKRVTLVAITVFSASVAAIGLADSVVTYVALYALAGLLSSGHAPLPYAKAISVWFDTKRGLALGIAMAGAGVGAALMPQIAGALVAKFGWREAYAIIGCLTWLVAFPMVALFVGDRTGVSDDGRPLREVAGDDFAMAVRRPDFWIIAVAILLVVTALNGTIAHFVALLTDRGMPAEIATRMLIAVGLSTILGRLVSGYLLDRIFAPILAAAMFAIPILGLALLLILPASIGLALIVAILVGVGLGAEVDAIGYLVGRYFGLRRYGQIYGYIFAAFTIGTGAGPYLMGLSFDLTHSYSAALIGFIAILAIASLLIMRLGAYRYAAAEQAVPAAASDLSAPRSA